MKEMDKDDKFGLLQLGNQEAKKLYIKKVYFTQKKYLFTLMQRNNNNSSLRLALKL